MLASPPATETSKHPLGDPEIGGTLRFPFSGTQLFNTLTSLTTRVDTMMWCGFGSRTRHVTAATSASSTTRSSSALPFVIDYEMAMTRKAAVFLKVRTRDGLTSRMLGIERRGPQDDVLAVETCRRSGESACVQTQPDPIFGPYGIRPRADLVSIIASRRF
jgi:hypothetical protein